MIIMSNVAKSYAGKPVLRDVSLAIDRGSFVGLVGQSGAGKTTLLKSINRLVEIDGGAIAIDGRDIRDRPTADLRRHIGYAFQGVGLFPHMTVAENIWLVPRLQALAESGRQARIAELLDLVSLPAELATRRPAQLSGGQAQRVGFARALAAAPSIMLMDEPFGAVDPVTRADLGRAYRALHDGLGLTSVLVTHDMTEALLLADRVIVMDGGRIAADMTPRQLLRDRDNPVVAGMIDVVRDQAARLGRLAHDT
jgi:osmoprotectant transport system ATP-binding protein